MSASAVSISPLNADERPAFVRAVALSFGETLDDDAVAHHIATELGDPTRSLAARTDGRIIGTTTALDFTMTVPLARPVPCAGVTSVAVAPTHRRRGVLTSLMRHQIDDLHAGGTAWAALYASESAIYGRYGYGVGSRALSFRLDDPWWQFADTVEPAAIDLLDGPGAAGRLTRIYDHVRADTPGMMSVSEEQLRLHLEYDPPGARGSASARHVAALDDAAFAIYRIKRGWSDTGPDGTVQVERCMAVDATSLRQMWRFLLNLDLVQHLEAHARPIDDPLPWWLAERRRLRVSYDMPCYVRLVDVGAALAQRGTTGDTAVVVDITDGFCPWNARRWRLEGDGAALHCVPSGEDADVTLDTRELASLSLGGVTPFELARAGLIQEQRAGGLPRLTTLLASHRPPWNPFIF